MAAGDPGTDAARLEVLRAREDLLGEVERLGASARAATDIRAQVSRHPGKAAAAVGGAAFLVLGGPRRLLRGVRRAGRGPTAAYPPSLLPEEVERVMRSLGGDGEKVRGVLERGFADYVTEKKASGRRAWRSAALGLLVPAARIAMKSGARSLLDPKAAPGADVRTRVRDAFRAAGFTPREADEDARTDGRTAPESAADAASRAARTAADAASRAAGAGRPGFRGTRPGRPTR